MEKTVLHGRVGDLSRGMSRRHAAREHAPETVLDAISVAVVSVDPAGAVRLWNEAAERLLGWHEFEALGRHLTEVLVEPEGDVVSLVVEGGSLDGAEVRVRTRGGDMLDVAVWSAPLRSSDDVLDGYVLTLADISARKRLDAERTRQARDAAERAENETVLNRLRFLADASNDLSGSLDLDATLARTVLAAVPELADWCTLHLLEPGGTVATVARAAADPSLEQTLMELQKRYPPTRDGRSPGGQALRTGHANVQSEVTEEWLESTALDADHLSLLKRLAPCSVMGVPLTARDRTIGAMTFASSRPDRRYDAPSLAMAEALARRAALAIDNARLHAQTRDALRARETFLSVASHELGGPLARLQLYTEVLQLALARKDLDDDLLKRGLGSIQRSTSRLAAITQDLLDVARWHGGDIQVSPARLDFGKLVRQVVRSYRARVDGPHQILLRVQRGRHLVLVDAARLEQVCENLLDNACKYSADAAEVRVGVRSEGGGVLLQVVDRGIGIPADATELIFEPFGRAPNAEARGVPGMGLGLYLCRNIVERHGGRIWATSARPRQGTTLSVWLPGAAA